MEMIDFDNKPEDVLCEYIDKICSTDKTVGIIANRELVEYILDTIIDFEETSIKEIDFTEFFDIDEYLLSIDDDGYITCIPVEDYIVLDDVDIVYIDMDGGVKQDIIDYCVNEDKEVILFGQKDNDCDKDCENCPLYYVDHSNDDNDDDIEYVNKDGELHGFTASKTDGNSHVNYSYYTTEELSQDDIDRILKTFRF